MHIADDRPEARAVERVMLAQHVTAEKAVRSILSSAVADVPERNYIQEGRGLFSHPEDAKILDEAVAIAVEERRRPSNQNVA